MSCLKVLHIVDCIGWDSCRVWSRLVPALRYYMQSYSTYCIAWWCHLYRPANSWQHNDTHRIRPGTEDWCEASLSCDIRQFQWHLLSICRLHKSWTKIYETNWILIEFCALLNHLNRVTRNGPKKYAMTGRNGGVRERKREIEGDRITLFAAAN